MRTLLEYLINRHTVKCTNTIEEIIDYILEHLPDYMKKELSSGQITLSNGLVIKDPNSKYIAPWLYIYQFFYDNDDVDIDDCIEHLRSFDNPYRNEPKNIIVGVYNKLLNNRILYVKNVRNQYIKANEPECWEPKK